MGQNVSGWVCTRQIAIDLWEKHGNGHWLPIMGHSMLPLLRDGDIVRVVPQQIYAVGDVVVFQQDGELLIHRIVTDMKASICRDAGQIWITQGDNCIIPDTPVMIDRLLGKVVTVRRGNAFIDFDHWSLDLVNRVIARCSRHSWCRLVQRYLLRLTAWYLRVLLKE